MYQFISIIIILPLVGFWFWMFRDLINNVYLSDDNSARLTWPPTTRFGWTVAFIIFNVFGALWYYVVEYRPRHL